MRYRPVAAEAVEHSPVRLVVHLQVELVEALPLMAANKVAFQLQGCQIPGNSRA
jgi:hypothetical protein